MISVLVPSRGRPELLRTSLESLLFTASDNYAVQLTVAVDPDDAPTLVVAKEFADEHGENQRDSSAQAALMRPRKFGFGLWTPDKRFGYSHLYEYYNGLAKFATGDWLMLWNDDAVMTTQDWDLRIQELPQSALVADLQSNMSSGGWICFPAIRRSMYEALGHFSAETPHVDSYLQDIARALAVVQKVDVWIEHNRPDVTGEAPDVTFLEGRSGLDHQGYFDPAGPVQAAIKEGIERVRTAFCMAGPIS